MKKVSFVLILIVLVALAIMGALYFINNKSLSADGKKFKETYESLNGQVNSSGKEYRSVSISESNPFVFSTGDDIVSRIENKETFYVYFGDKLCPWCRSNIEKAIEVAEKSNIKTIYYVPIWDDEGTEILRDKYKLNDDDTLEKVAEGTESYFRLLEYFKDYLPDYEYAANKNGGAKLGVQEKRIYAPTYLYVESGNAKRITSGLSEYQTGSRDELTEQILQDEESLFEDFFNN